MGKQDQFCSVFKVFAPKLKIKYKKLGTVLDGGGGNMLSEGFIYDGKCFLQLLNIFHENT